jgi:hypothetical protein
LMWSTKFPSSVIGATSLAALEVAISASIESLEAASAAAIESHSRSPRLGPLPRQQKKVRR